MARRALILVSGTILVGSIGLFAAFRGPRLGLAFTIATGVGRARVQQRIDELEAKAIARATFSAGDRTYLTDFYATLATGGQLSILVRQTGLMMAHYLAATGQDYRLSPKIFTQNQKVQGMANMLRERASRSACASPQSFSSGSFYMPDPSQLDSVFGLYHGTLRLSQHADPSGACVRQWRAEVPWTWPSYDSLREKYGNPHAESFPLPNIQSIFGGRERALFVDNGLGQYLEELGLAKHFVAFAEWPDD